MISRMAHSLNSLNELITELSYLKKDLGVSSKEYLLIQKVKRMTDLVIWGDKNNPSFFESFKESKVVDIYFQIVLKGANKELIICAIDSLSKLLINVSTPKSITYLISNDTINNMLSIKFKSLAIQVAEYYINFLKTLSQRLNDGNVSLFINGRYPNMPIAWQTIRFLNHPESMIRNTVRNIILSVLRLKDTTAINYLTNFPFVIYYSHLASFMRMYWDNLNQIMETELDPTHFINVVEEYEDVYLYFEDMLRISADPIKRCIHNGFLSEGLGYLISNLAGTKKSIGIRTALYLFAHIISNTQSAFLSDFICMMLFGRYINNKLLFSCTTVEMICSFRKEWNFRTFWDNYEDKLREHSLTVFNGKEIPKQPVKQEKVKEVSRFTEQGNNLFGESNAKYQSELRKLSNVYGLLYNNSKQLTLFDLFHLTKKQILQNQLSENTYIQNTIKKNIMKCLSSQDDCLVVLSIKLIMSLILNKHISREVLLFSGLCVDDQTGEKENRGFVGSVIKSCVSALGHSFESQTLRVSTVKILVAAIARILSPKIAPMGIEQTQQILSLYKLVLDKANSHLLNSKNNWEKTLEIYQASEAYCNKNQPFKISVTDLFPAEKQSSKEPSDNQQMYDFVLFILLRNLRYQLFPSRIKLSEIGLLRRNTIRIKLQPGKEIPLSEIANEDKIGCKYKDLTQNKYSSCYLLLSSPSVSILETLTNNKLKSVVDTSHKQTMNMIDRSDPRKLILIINDPVKRNLFLMFDDAKTCYLTKTRLDSLKTDSMSRYLAEIVKQIELCSQDVHFSL